MPAQNKKAGCFSQFVSLSSLMLLKKNEMHKMRVTIVSAVASLSLKLVSEFQKMKLDITKRTYAASNTLYRIGKRYVLIVIRYQLKRKTLAIE